MSRVAVILGTRPEAIKLAGVVEGLGAEAWVIHTGQHYDAALGAGVLAGVGYPEPDVAPDLGEPRGAGGRAEQLGAIVAALARLFDAERPAAAVVQGDTTSTLAGALAANAFGVPLVHVEAGLRSHDRRMPEEHNRVLTDHLSDLCCAVTETSAENLAAEGIVGDRVAVTGNTVVESVHRLLPDHDARAARVAALGLEPGRFVLATFHRPENVDHPESLAAVLDELARVPLPVVLPMHPRTAARVASFGLERAMEPLQVLPPLAPVAFLALAAEAAFWVSDSGGLQEEASILKRPVIVVRRSTERPEVQGTFATLVAPGTRPGVGEVAAGWCADLPAVHARLAALPTPYGDGSASARIVAHVHRIVDG